MPVKQWLVVLGKLVLCAGAYVAGMALGGMLASALALQPPAMPEGFDEASAGMAMMLESPLWALALLGIARSIAGRLWERALMLGALTWVANVLANQIEAASFGSMASGFWFTVVTLLVPSLLVAAAVAWLFPPAQSGATFGAAARSFFGRHSAAGWAWRLGLGALLFMPIYYGFGLLVVPFTIEFYRQGMYGLQIPPLSELLVIMLIRSVLFFLACLPILVAWQRGRWELALALGLALFYLVGLQPLLIANWMPWELRAPHLLEILADELVYAAALALLFGVGRGGARLPRNDGRSGMPAAT